MTPLRTRTRREATAEPEFPHGPRCRAPRLGLTWWAAPATGRFVRLRKCWSCGAAVPVEEDDDDATVRWTSG